MTESIAEFELPFSHHQIMIYDHSARVDTLEWEDVQSRQGFVRRGSAVYFGMIESYGVAYTRVYIGSAGGTEGHDRVIAVPFEAMVGRIFIDDPEELPDVRFVTVPAGLYTLTCAQRVIQDNFEEIDLWFETVEQLMLRSQILKADPALDPPEILVEDARLQ